MTKERIAYLCGQYLNDDASQEELKELEAALRTPDLEEEVKSVLMDVYADFPKEVYADLDRKVAADIFERISVQITEKSHGRSWRRTTRASQGKFATPHLWLASAAAVVAIVFGVWFFNTEFGTLKYGQADLVYKNDIAPGAVGATLTLANGKQIRLSEATDGELAKEAGVTITKTADGQLLYEVASSADDQSQHYNTLTTAKGETYQVRLPDGSKVWLNAASSLTYAANLLDQGKRRVKLDGEGYFEVARDKQHPFIVQTDQQETEVLGTHFNINSYADEGVTKTTLLEGSVLVSPLPVTEQGTTALLKPGQQSALKTEAGGVPELRVTKANHDQAIAWKNGYFRFNGEQIRPIMKQLARWYNIDVAYEGRVTTEGFTGKISRTKNISEVLMILERTKGVHFKIEGRRVTIIP